MRLQRVVATVLCFALGGAARAAGTGAKPSSSAIIRVDGQQMRVWKDGTGSSTSIIRDAHPPIWFTDGLRPRERMTVSGPAGRVELVGIARSTRAASPPAAQPSPRKSTAVLPSPPPPSTVGPKDSAPARPRRFLPGLSLEEPRVLSIEEYNAVELERVRDLRQREGKNVSPQLLGEKERQARARKTGEDLAGASERYSRNMREHIKSGGRENDDWGTYLKETRAMDEARAHGRPMTWEDRVHFRKQEAGAYRQPTFGKTRKPAELEAVLHMGLKVLPVGRVRDISEPVMVGGFWNIAAPPEGIERVSPYRLFEDRSGQTQDAYWHRGALFIRDVTSIPTGRHTMTNWYQVQPEKLKEAIGRKDRHREINQLTAEKDKRETDEHLRKMQRLYPALYPRSGW